MKTSFLTLGSTRTGWSQVTRDTIGHSLPFPRTCSQAPSPLTSAPAYPSPDLPSLKPLTPSRTSGSLSGILAHRLPCALNLPCCRTTSALREGCRATRKNGSLFSLPLIVRRLPTRAPTLSHSSFLTCSPSLCSPPDARSARPLPLPPAALHNPRHHHPPCMFPPLLQY
jgi:hypothetical protein